MKSLVLNYYSSKMSLSVLPSNFLQSCIGLSHYNLDKIHTPTQNTDSQIETLSRDIYFLAFSTFDYISGFFHMQHCSCPKEYSKDTEIKQTFILNNSTTTSHIVTRVTSAAGLQHTDGTYQLQPEKMFSCITIRCSTKLWNLEGSTQESCN